MGTQQTAATATAGNTVQTLQPTHVEVAVSDEFIKIRMEEAKAVFAATEAKQSPKSSPAAPSTGPAPIEYVPPVLGRKSPDGSNAEVLDGSKMQPDVVSKSQFTKPLVGRDEFNELLARIDNFNNRSSQKI